MEKHLAMFEFLLQFDAIDVNAKSTAGNVPLHYLVRHNFTEVEGKEISWNFLLILE